MKEVSCNLPITLQLGKSERKLPTKLKPPRRWVSPYAVYSKSDPYRDWNNFM